jgi:hypothetical protein
MNSVLHFLLIYHSGFYLDRFYENQDGICFLWDFGLWMLTIQPSHFYTLAYCRPIHLISIEFQNIDSNSGSPPKKYFFPFNCYNLAIREVTLTEIFLHTIGIVRYKILWLEVKNYHFILIIGPHVNKYIFQAQYSPKRP